MTPVASRRLALAIFGLVVIGVAVSATFEVMDPKGTNVGDLLYIGAFLLFPVVGVVLATRRPRNALGWLMLGIGVVTFTPNESFGSYALGTGHDGGVWWLASTQWSWVPTIGLAGTFLLLLFPDGRLPSPRWRRFARGVALGMVVTSVGIFLLPGDLGDLGYPELQNPFGIRALEPFAPLVDVALVTIPVGILGSSWSLIVRFRRSGPTERLQIRWLASAGAVAALLYAAALVATFLTGAAWVEGDTPGWVLGLQNAAMISFALLPISIGIAVLRYRLYDMDVVIRKAVVYGGLAAFVTGIYLLLVIAVGSLTGYAYNPVLSGVAAAAVALAFQPVRRRAQRVANRIVYGERASPYEVLAEFSQRVAETYADDDVLSRMARVIGEGVGARRADVWLRMGDRLRAAATWPSGAPLADPVRISRDGSASLPDADASFPVEHRGERLGVLSVVMPPSDPIDDPRRKLVSDLAAQAGLVLRNVRLTEDLRQRLEELKAAQRRLVAAQDQERRRLERNIHDGAQQQLVALTVKLRLADSFVGPDDKRAHALLRDLQTAASEALNDLRDLARGIYPPLLADKGLVEAIAAQSRRSAIPVEVSPNGIGRYPADVEAAVYFSVLEALQNVAKYARASQARVELRVEEQDLVFEVEDDGVGFDLSGTSSGSGLQGIADRLGAMEGSFEVRSATGEGTTVVGRIPIREGS